MRLSATEKIRLNAGLLALRVALGIIFLIHGYPKLFGGVEKWRAVGSAMSNLGIDSFHVLFGFMAGFSEFFGGILLIIGLFTTPALVLLISTMIVAVITQISMEAEFPGIAHPLSMAVVFISLLITGPGQYSADYKFKK